MTNLPFVNYAFKASGGTANRTMPDRLTEIKNVKDFGANGTGGDDTAAIQAAVNWTSGANRGTIFFPAGSYVLTSPITFNYNGDLSIRFLGDTSGTYISGNFNGFLLDRHLATPNNTTGGRIFERLNFSNSHATGGCIRIGSSAGVTIRDCTFGGHINITTEDEAGASSTNVMIQTCQFARGGNEIGSHHIIIGGGGIIENCGTKNGADVFCRAYGGGLMASGNRTERCNTVWLLGVDSGGNNVGLKGFSIHSQTFEGNWTGFDFAGPCDGFYIGSMFMMGHDNTNAGVADPPSAHGTEYSFRVRANNAKNGLIENISIGSWHEVAGISIANATSRTNLLFRNVSSVATGGGGADWVMPTNAYTAKFENANTTPIWTYAQLPTGSNAQEGDEFDISDSPTNVWGDPVTAGGAPNHRVRVRRNNSGWTVMGK